MEHIGSKIKAQRLANGISRQELANVLDVKYETVRKWEAGLAQPRPQLYGTICTALRCDEAYLVLGVEQSVLDRLSRLIESEDLSDDKARISTEIEALPLYAQAEILAEIAQRLSTKLKK